MFKLDDDAYLHFPGLERTLKPLRSEIRRSDSNNFVLGKAFGDDNRPILPIRVPNRPYKRKTVHSKKWWCPGYMFDGKEYPKMVSGAGYVMNYGAAECVYKVRNSFLVQKGVRFSRASVLCQNRNKQCVFFPPFRRSSSSLTSIWRTF